MRLFKTFLSPLFVILSFLLIVISGEQTGGFYFSYLWRAIPHGNSYALLAIFGIVILLLTALGPVSSKTLLTPILNQSGALLLLMSIYIFFAGDSTGYNTSTFFQVVPLITIIIFLLLVIWFIYINFAALLSKN